MINKPVFKRWLHKELWTLLMTNPSMEKYDALSIIMKRYKLVKPPLNGCFACEALKQYEIQRAYEEFGITEIDNDHITCTTEYCPLDWTYGIYIPDDICGCSYLFQSRYKKHTGEWRGLYSRWETERKLKKRRKLARIISDLPLSKMAKSIYVIEEFHL